MKLNNFVGIWKNCRFCGNMHNLLRGNGRPFLYHIPRLCKKLPGTSVLFYVWLLGLTLPYETVLDDDTEVSFAS